MGEPSSSVLFEQMSESQRQFEQRYNCPVCLEAKLEVVYGLCQHKVCAACLYGTNTAPGDDLAMQNRCPMCSKPDVFPPKRPDIPEDTIELQKLVGIRRCPYEGCNLETWEWEMIEHLEQCEFAIPPELRETTVPKKNTHLKRTARMSSYKPVRKSKRRSVLPLSSQEI